MKNKVLAFVLIGLAAASACYGGTLDGHLLGRFWRGTVFVEIGVLLCAVALGLVTRGARTIPILAATALAAILAYVGAQHFARAARRNAIAEGVLPEIPGRQWPSLEEIRALFAPCFPERDTGHDDFYELELGTVPPDPADPGHPRPRWLLTQPYAPMTGISRGFRVVRAYLSMKSSAADDGERTFASELAALGLDPRPFIDALNRASTPAPIANPEISALPSREPAVAPPSAPASARQLQIPADSTSVLAYPAHQVPEIDEAALHHPDAIDIDPANLHEMNYGWELVWISRTHPRICLHTREGAGDLEGQRAGVGDFHGLHLNRQLSELVYDFKVERPGLYRLNALILPEADKCSNYPQAAIDDGDFHDLGHNDCIPYQWYDADWKGGVAVLGAGWHQLHLHFMQDGITIARFWLTPYRLLPQLPSAAATPPEHPPLELVLTRRSMSILQGARADFGAWVCNTGGLSGAAALDADLDPGRGRPHVTFHQDIQLDPDMRVQEFPIAMDLPRDLPAREMRVTVTLSTPAGGPKAVRESTLVKPFRALLLGPIPRPHDKDLSITDPEYRAPTLADFQNDAKPGVETWGRYPADAVTYYALYDLNRAFGADTKEGIVFSRAYVAARLDVPKGGPEKYLFKIMGDDIVSVWIDGAQIYNAFQKGPPIRYPGTVEWPLTAGEHTMIMHVDQTTGWWQCGVHLRTAEDDVCDIEGVDR